MNTIRHFAPNLLSTVRCQTILAKRIQMPQNILVRHKYSIKLFRQKLPKYKKSLSDLPDLTKLLTGTEDHLGIEDALRLREEKLAAYREYLPVNSSATLLEALFNKDNDIDRLLRVIDDNLEDMTSFYIGVSFEAIDDMVRAQLCDKSTVIVSPEFRRLCTKTIYKIRFFDADEVVKLVKCVSSLKMREETLLVQAALNMARHLINDFKPEELKYITGSYDLLRPPKFIEKNHGSIKTVKNEGET